LPNAILGPRPGQAGPHLRWREASDWHRGGGGLAGARVGLLVNTKAERGPVSSREVGRPAPGRARRGGAVTGAAPSWPSPSRCRRDHASRKLVSDCERSHHRGRRDGRVVQRLSGHRRHHAGKPGAGPPPPSSAATRFGAQLADCHLPACAGVPGYRYLTTRHPVSGAHPRTRCATAARQLLCGVVSLLAAGEARRWRMAEADGLGPGCRPSGPSSTASSRTGRTGLPLVACQPAAGRSVPGADQPGPGERVIGTLEQVGRDCTVYLAAINAADGRLPARVLPAGAGRLRGADGRAVRRARRVAGRAPAVRPRSSW